MKKNIETFIACDAEYEDAKVVIFGAPFDSTTSYRPGARFGSAAIRHESYGLETYSPYLNCDLEDLNVYDAGDLELPMGSAAVALAARSGCTADILNAGNIPFMLGGVPLATLGTVRAAAT